MRTSRLPRPLSFYLCYIGLPLLVVIGVSSGFYAWHVWQLRQPDQQPITWDSIAVKETLRPWSFIVIHHSASKKGSTSGIDKHHREVNKWDGIGYHFVIGNGRGMRLGRIEYTFRWVQQREGAHAGGDDKRYNETGIGICVIGHFDKEQPNDFQFNRCAELCACLIESIPTLTIHSIIGHDQVPGKETKCPGEHFSVFLLQRKVALLLDERKRQREVEHNHER